MSLTSLVLPAHHQPHWGFCSSYYQRPPHRSPATPAVPRKSLACAAGLLPSVLSYNTVVIGSRVSRSGRVLATLSRQASLCIGLGAMAERLPFEQVATVVPGGLELTSSKLDWHLHTIHL